MGRTCARLDGEAARWALRRIPSPATSAKVSASIEYGPECPRKRLGERADLHHTEIGLLERGARVPRVDTVAKLTSTLTIRPGELLDGIEWSPDSNQPGGFELRSSSEAGKT